MNKNEFAKLVATMRLCYQKENILSSKEALEVWYRFLGDIPYKVAELALYKWVSENKWSPTISDIREMATNIQLPDFPDWGAAWQSVLFAIRRFGLYQISEALASMDEITRETVERLGFQQLCTSENLSVDRANFRSIYTELCQRRIENSKIPVELKMAIEQLKSNNYIVELNNDENDKKSDFYLNNNTFLLRNNA